MAQGGIKLRQPGFMSVGVRLLVDSGHCSHMFGIAIEAYERAFSSVEVLRCRNRSGEEGERTA